VTAGSPLGPFGFLRASLAWLRPYRTRCALIVLTLVPAVAFCTAQPLLLRALVDEAVIPRDHARAVLLIVALAARGWAAGSPTTSGCGCSSTSSGCR